MGSDLSERSEPQWSCQSDPSLNSTILSYQSSLVKQREQFSPKAECAKLYLSVKLRESNGPAQSTNWSPHESTEEEVLTGWNKWVSTPISIKLQNKLIPRLVDFSSNFLVDCVSFGHTRSDLTGNHENYFFSLLFVRQTWNKLCLIQFSCFYC